MGVRGRRSGPVRARRPRPGARSSPTRSGRERRLARPDAGPVLLGGLGFTGATPAATTIRGRRSGPPRSCCRRSRCRSTRSDASADRRRSHRTESTTPTRTRSSAAWESIVGGGHRRHPRRARGSTPDRRRATRPRLLGADRRHVRGRGRARPDRQGRPRPAGRRSRRTADLDVVGALRHLAATAPESTTYAFTRGGTTFLGATPERLARTVGRSFETVAIAGSAPRGADPAEDARFAAGAPREREGPRGARGRRRHAARRPRADRRDADRRRRARDPAAAPRPAPRDADDRDAARGGRAAGARRRCSTRHRRSAASRATSRSTSSPSTKGSIAAGTRGRSAGSAPMVTAS